MKRSIGLGIVILMILLLQVCPVIANKSGTSIEGSPSAVKGTEITLRIHITHSANSRSHYTEWVKVMANKKEIARWDYTKDNRPEAADFTKEIKIKVTEDTEVISEASCNNHGSKGVTTHKITVK